MNNRFVIVKDNTFYNVESNNWLADKASFWGYKDKLLQDVQGFIVAGKIDAADKNIHVREVMTMAGKHGCMLCEFIFKNKDKDLVNSALAKLSEN